MQPQDGHIADAESVAVGRDMKRLLVTFPNDVGFHSSYQRNNKKGGKKHLRCFPCCGPNHKQSHACEVPVRVRLEMKGLENNAKDQILVVARFLSLEGKDQKTICEDDLLDRLGDIHLGKEITLSFLARFIRSVDSPFLPLYRARFATFSPDLSSVDFEFREKAWHYGWKGGRYKQSTAHILRIYVLHCNENLNLDTLNTLDDCNQEQMLRCVARLDSTPFSIYSSRCAPKKPVQAEINPVVNEKSVKIEPSKRKPFFEAKSHHFEESPDSNQNLKRENIIPTTVQKYESVKRPRTERSNDVQRFPVVCEQQGSVSPYISTGSDSPSTDLDAEDSRYIPYEYEHGDKRLRPIDDEQEDESKDNSSIEFGDDLLDGIGFLFDDVTPDPLGGDFLAEHQLHPDYPQIPCPNQQQEQQEQRMSWQPTRLDNSRGPQSSLNSLDGALLHQEKTSSAHAQEEGVPYIEEYQAQNFTYNDQLHGQDGYGVSFIKPYIEEQPLYHANTLPQGASAAKEHNLESFEQDSSSKDVINVQESQEKVIDPKDDEAKPPSNAIEELREEVREGRTEQMVEKAKEVKQDAQSESPLDAFAIADQPGISMIRVPDEDFNSNEPPSPPQVAQPVALDSQSSLTRKLLRYLQSRNIYLLAFLIFFLITVTVLIAKAAVDSTRPRSYRRGYDCKRFVNGPEDGRRVLTLSKIDAKNIRMLPPRENRPLGTLLQCEKELERYIEHEKRENFVKRWSNNLEATAIFFGVIAGLSLLASLYVGMQSPSFNSWVTRMTTSNDNLVQATIVETQHVV